MIDSSSLGVGFPTGKNRIHPDAFLFNPELYYIWYRSYGRTTGNISQLFNANPKLQYIWSTIKCFQEQFLILQVIQVFIMLIYNIINYQEQYQDLKT